MGRDKRRLFVLKVLSVLSLLVWPVAVIAEEIPELDFLEFLGSAERVEGAVSGGKGDTDSGADQWIDPLQMFDTWRSEEAEATAQRTTNTEVENDD